MLLDYIIAARYGLTKPDLELADADVARGTYVIGMRKGDEDLKAAIDGALAEHAAAGELQRIYARWHLPELPATAGARATAIGRAPRATFDAAQVLLFLRGAVVTLVVSLLGDGARGAARASARARAAVRRGPVALRARTRTSSCSAARRCCCSCTSSTTGSRRRAPSALAAAMLGLGLNYGAYEAEVYRGALQAIPRGQSEAARGARAVARADAAATCCCRRRCALALPAMTNDFDRAAQGQLAGVA